MTDIEKSDRKDMFVSAISKISVKSKAFLVSALDMSKPDILTIYDRNPAKNMAIPQYFIRGSFVVDKSLVNEKKDFGLDINADKYYGGAGSINDRTSSIITLDINLGETAFLLMQPGITSSNSIAVVRHGKSRNIDAGIQKFGINYQFNYNLNEGVNQAIRTLIELSVIELLGKAARVPYWECLTLSSTNPMLRENLTNWYSKLDNITLKKFIETKLKAIGLYNDNTKLEQAISIFRKKHGLLPNNTIDFELYFQLMLEPTPIPDIKIIKNGKIHKTLPGFIKKSQINPLDLLMSTEHGNKPYHIGDDIILNIAVTTDAYVHC